MSISPGDHPAITRRQLHGSGSYATNRMLRFLTRHAAELRQQGAEAEARWRIDDRLSASVGAAYLDSEYPSYPDANAPAWALGMELLWRRGCDSSRHWLTARRRTLRESRMSQRRPLVEGLRSASSGLCLRAQSGSSSATLRPQELITASERQAHPEEHRPAAEAERRDGVVGLGSGVVGAVGPGRDAGDA